MKVMTDIARSVAANTRTDNVLDGKAEVYLTRNSALSFYIVAAAVGIRATVLVGDTVVIDDQEISDANHYPVRPDDLTARSGGAGGDLVGVFLRNTTVGAIVVNTVVDVQGV